MKFGSKTNSNVLYSMFTSSVLENFVQKNRTEIRTNTNLKVLNSMEMSTFLFFRPEVPFLSKLGPKH